MSFSGRIALMWLTHKPWWYYWSDKGVLIKGTDGVVSKFETGYAFFGEVNSRESTAGCDACDWVCWLQFTAPCAIGGGTFISTEFPIFFCLNWSRFSGPENINCRMNNVVYILTCTQCKKQYIGETGTPFIERWKEHLYDIRVKRPYPVARHFNETYNHQKATFHAKILSLIKGPANRAAERRKHKESRWIHTFQSFQPEGINLREQLTKYANFPENPLHQKIHTPFQTLKPRHLYP